MLVEVLQGLTSDDGTRERAQAYEFARMDE